ncbi:hypothetical protein GEMRC1_010294 [Eukaryota sp. GEM-RC1]
MPSQDKVYSTCSTQLSDQLLFGHASFGIETFTDRSHIVFFLLFPPIKEASLSSFSPSTLLDKRIFLPPLCFLRSLIVFNSGNVSAKYSKAVATYSKRSNIEKDFLSASSLTKGC